MDGPGDFKLPPGSWDSHVHIIDEVGHDCMPILYLLGTLVTPLLTILAS